MLSARGFQSNALVSVALEYKWEDMLEMQKLTLDAPIVAVQRERVICVCAWTQAGAGCSKKCVRVWKFGCTKGARRSQSLHIALH